MIVTSQYSHNLFKQGYFTLVINSNLGRFELGCIGLNWVEMSWVELC